MLAAHDTLEAHFVPIFELNQLIIDTIVNRLPEAPDKRLRSRLASELRTVYASGVVDMRTKDEISAGRLPKVRILDKNVLSEMSTSAFASPRDVYVYLDSVLTDSALHQYFVRAKLPNLLLPNYTRNDEECRRHFEYDYLTLTADRGIILQGQTVIDKGAIITSQDYTNLRTYETMLAQLNTNQNQSKWLMLLGQAGYVALLLAALMVYLHFFCPAIYGNFRAVVFVYSTVALFFLVGIGLNHFVAQGIYCFVNKNSTCVLQKQENFGLHCKKYGMIKMKTIFILTLKKNLL